MTTWQSVSLGDALDFFDHRRIPLNSAQRAARKGSYPYYGAQSVIDWVDDYLFDGRYLLIPEDGENLNSRKLPIAFFAEGRFWVNNHAHVVRAKVGVADDVFLKHVLNSVDIREYVTGAAQPKLSQANLRRMQILLPPLDVQRRIASILGAYDDLIDVNRRRIAILEEMARSLFDEWFVRFRFPGHQDYPKVATKHGVLPAGWTYAAFKSISEILSGFAFKSATFGSNGQYKLVTIKNIHDGRFNSICESRLDHIPRNMPQHCFLSDGDICMSLTGNVGRVCMIYGEQHLLNQRVAKLSPKYQEAYAYTYVFARSEPFQKRLIQISNGVAQQNLSPIQAVNLDIISPSREHVCLFSKIVKPMLEAIVGANKVMLNLQEQCDLILPRLISGDLALATAERELDAAA